MKVVAIVQARMGSTRFPGKVMKKVNGKPLLDYQIERVKQAKFIDEIVIATTVNTLDDELIHFCETHFLSYYRGSEEDVLLRYYEAAKICNANVIVRITSDCPLIDPDIIDSVIVEYLKNPTLDYVSNTIERTYPRGMDTEVFSFSLLERLNKEATSPSDREHVTAFIARHPQCFTIKQVKGLEDESNYRLTVDTPEDFFVIEQILEHLSSQQPSFSLSVILDFLKDKPEIAHINQHIQQKNI